MEQYPDYLPLPLRDGYGLTSADPIRATPMVTGRPTFRVMQTSVPMQVAVNFNFSQAEAGLFEAWFAQQLNNGFELFQMKLQTPAGFKLYQCRFMRMYQGPQLVQITRWRYSANLFMLERPLIPDGWLGAPTFWLNKSAFDISMNKDWPAA